LDKDLLAISSNLTKRIALQGAMLVEASYWGALWAHNLTSLLLFFGSPPTMMDAVSATIVAGGLANIN
jgi:hypothetical protein